MFPEKSILKSKLRYSGSTTTIKRSQLESLFSEIAQKKVTTVVAGAGYGKSTLIHQAMQYLALGFIWYRLDALDKDPATFIHYLINGLREHFPQIGKRTLKILAEIADMNQEQHVLFTEFLSEIDECVAIELAIVFDDYHEINDSVIIRRFIQFLIENSAHTIHIILVSRIDPDLPLSLFRGRRQVLDISDKQLAFSAPEIEALYETIFDLNLKPKTVQVLKQKTGGWVSALILFYHALKDKSARHIEDFLLNLKGSNQIVSQFLEENVYALQPEATKTFLLKTSLLQRMQIGICNYLVGIDNAHAILAGLARKHLFTFCEDEAGKWYRYHQLFSEFLKNKLYTEKTSDEIKQLHLQIASFLEMEGDYQEALRHYLNDEFFEKASVLIGQYSFVLNAKGYLPLLSSYVQQIAPHHLESNPWLIFLQAHICDLSGKNIESIQYFERALTLFRKCGDKEGEGVCIEALGREYLATANILKAEKFLNRSLQHMQKDTPHYIISLSTLGIVSTLLGKMQKANTLFDKAKSLLPNLKNKDQRKAVYAWIQVGRGLRLLFIGEFKKARDLAFPMKEELDKSGFYIISTFFYYISSHAAFFLGHFQEGFENAAQGLSIMHEKQIDTFLSYSFLLVTSALNAIGLGQFQQAIDDCKVGLKLSRRSGIRWGILYCSHILYQVYSILGDSIEAENHLQTCVQLSRDMDVNLEKGNINCTLVSRQLDQGQFDEASSLLSEAENISRQSKFGSFRVHLLFTRLYHLTNQKEKALQRVSNGLTICAANQYDLWLKMEFSWIIPLLVETFARKEAQAYLEILFEVLDENTNHTLRQLLNAEDPAVQKAAQELLKINIPDQSPNLRIFCLGEFKIFKGEDEIRFKQWKSKKALLLFKYFILARKKGYVPKEIIMEQFWPDENPQKVINRLHVTLHILRKSLEPELKKGMKSTFISNHADAYRLDLGHNGEVDMELFEQEIARAEGFRRSDSEKQIQHYLNAEAMYRGDLFAEDPYEEWCILERNRLKEVYLNLLQNILKHFELKQDYEKCIHYAKKYILADPYEEDIYCLLMNTYSAMGKKSLVVQTFKTCKKNIEQELACDLNPKTRHLYKKLVSQAG